MEMVHLDIRSLTDLRDVRQTHVRGLAYMVLWDIRTPAYVVFLQSVVHRPSSVRWSVLWAIIVLCETRTYRVILSPRLCVLSSRLLTDQIGISPDDEKAGPGPRRTRIASLPILAVWSWNPRKACENVESRRSEARGQETDEGSQVVAGGDVSQVLVGVETDRCWPFRYHFDVAYILDIFEIDVRFARRG
ncbi:hypothetical protein BC936DRAFT_149453 [Jimgerdemannia flammicorona]|uniref:Uncharacterized protein n=1 Tax=Jimgerdemannia flammicorona TaxID=994334 RepID=A0A433D0S6_9FUNG|nr:hypothetical protein BC936DRAFT_149453 [Jimgerdemannia flammicorona]